MITSFVCFIRKTISHSLSAQSKGSLYFDTFKTYCELSSVYLYITGKVNDMSTAERYKICVSLLLEKWKRKL